MNELTNSASPSGALVTMGFGSLQGYEFMERTAVLFSESTMVPTPYRARIEKGYGRDATVVDNPAAKANCIIALNMSQRMNADPLMIMQNLHVIEGRPSWSSQFIIAAINSCGRYSPLRFDVVQGEEMDATYTTFEWVDRKKEARVTTVRIRNVTCIAWAVELATKTRLESPKVSMEMAVNEGWYGKNGSKWQSMPDLMLRYRSAAFFGRIYAPELLMGLPSAEESRDIIDVTEQADGSYAANFSTPPAGGTTSSAATAKDATPKAYSADDFAANLPKWEEVIKGGRKTADDFINFAASRGTPYTEAQIAQLRAVKAGPVNVATDVEAKPATTAAAAPATEAATKPAPAAVAYATVAAALHAATTQEALALAAIDIGEVASPEQRSELIAIHDTRVDTLPPF